MASVTARGCSELARWEKTETKGDSPSPSESFQVLAVRTQLILRSDGALLQRVDLRERSYGQERWNRGSQSIKSKLVKGFPDLAFVRGWMERHGFKEVA